MNKFQKWAEKRQAKKVTESVRVESREISLDEHIDNQWQDLKDEHSGIFAVARAFCTVIGFLFIVWSLAMVNLKVDCNHDKGCREWVERN